MKCLRKNIQGQSRLTDRHLRLPSDFFLYYYYSKDYQVLFFNCSNCSKTTVQLKGYGTEGVALLSALKLMFDNKNISITLHQGCIELKSCKPDKVSFMELLLFLWPALWVFKLLTSVKQHESGENIHKIYSENIKC